MNILTLPRFFCLLFLLCIGYGITPGLAVATEKSTLSPELESALGALLDAAPQGKAAPSEATLHTLLKFVTTNTTPQGKVTPATRPAGLGAYQKETLNMSLKTIISYTLNPAIPGEAIYPSSVRRNAWFPNSELLKNNATFLNATFPPATTLVTRGTEYEETTPDISSGCYYAYKLNRLFVLTAYEGRTVLFSVSSMPESSTVGRKGAIAGNDKNWNYVYTPEQGTNLSMLGWAETYLYGSASVSVFIDAGNKTDLYMFKWAKAGWSGMNVVKRSHITAGLTRFTSGLRQVLESPKAPSASDLAARFAELRGLKDSQLQAQLSDFGKYLETLGTGDSIISGKEFQTVLKGGGYAATLGRNEAISELMKLYVREKLGTLPTTLAPSGTR
ncbi:MAG: hypothetical protein RRY20_02540 [Bilophila sp.]